MICTQPPFDPTRFNFTPVNMISEAPHAARIPIMADPTVQQGFWSSIFSWFGTNVFHYILIIFAIILIFQIIQNIRTKESRLGTLMSFSLFCLAVFGLCTYNLWMGIILGLLTAWLTILSNKYKDNSEEEEDIPVQQPIKIPNQIPIRSIPIAFEGYNMPSIGVNIWNL